MEVFNLNIRPGKTCPVIHCSQFDKGRAFRANLYDGSEVFTLTAAETLSVIEKKSDGNMVTIGVTNTSDSYVEFATTEQMTALAGPQICELRIVEGDTLIGSANFILDCEESPDTGIESESEIHNLETQIQDINNEIVPDMVAEEVANQYDSQNVIFDDAPTENHGTGYAVTSEGVKNALDGKPDNLSDLGDVNISSPTSNQALVYNPTTHKWENAMIPQTGTIEDVAIASFSDGADDVPVSELIVDITAVQAGSGDPSPDNVREISGFDSGVITVDNDQITNTYTVDFGRTVYGGRLNVTTGELTITHIIVDLGSLTWEYDSRNNRFATMGISESVKKPSDIYEVTNSICSAYSVTSFNQFWNSTDGKYTISTSGVISIRDSRYTDASAFKTAMGGVQFVYELATPIEIQLTPVQVKTLLGNNNIFVNTGNIRRLVYFKTGCENIAKLIEAAPNLASVQSVNGRTGAVELDAFNTPYDSENSIAEKIDDNTQAIEAISSKDFTFTPASGVTASSVTACKNDKLCIFAAEIRFTGNANAWTVLGTVDVTLAVSHVLSAGVNTSNGSYLGMVEVRQDGTVRIYPTSNVSNGYVMFSLNFKTT